MNSPQKLPKKDEFSPVVVGVRIFFAKKLSTALMGKKKQTLSILEKSLRFAFGVI